ncbi:MAG TPA: SDR family NAD(P)-dependent oxidoreductase, partial [Solirubrobacterales bacterium]|nr:SDR family NAD(P)-dependent oxidoreductase [Solirubrobacterales bacterium]
RLAAELPGSGHTVIAADLGTSGAARDLVERAGSIDVLVANAGLSGERADFTAASDQTIEQIVRVNLEAPMLLVSAVLPQMIERGSGQIVLVASLAGKVATPNALYSSTKSGLRTFGWSLRPKLAKSGVGVTVITPGFIGGAGMFARTGRKMPPGTMVKLDRYAVKVARAVERNRSETVIAPPLLRAVSHLGLVWPSLPAALLKRGG